MDDGEHRPLPPRQCHLLPLHLSQLSSKLKVRSIFFLSILALTAADELCRVHYVLSALIRGAILAALPVVLCSVAVAISLIAGRESSVSQVELIISAREADSRSLQAYVPFAEVVPTVFACSILFTRKFYGRRDLLLSVMT